MERLRAKLRKLGLKYDAVAGRVGKEGRQLAVYMSEAKLGPGPAWVEECLRGALADAGTPPAEVEELIADWRKARQRMKNEVSTDDLTLEQRLANAVKDAWDVHVVMQYGLQNLTETLQIGEGMDEDELERVAKAQVKAAMLQKLINDLDRELWERRRAEFAQRVEDAEAEHERLEREEKELARALRDLDETSEVLAKCAKFGVDPNKRLELLRDESIVEAWRTWQDLRKQFETYDMEPLYNGPRDKFRWGHERSRVTFAKTAEEAAAIMLEPWTVAETMPEVTIALYRLRHTYREQIRSADDLVRKVSEAGVSIAWDLRFTLGYEREWLPNRSRGDVILALRVKARGTVKDGNQQKLVSLDEVLYTVPMPSLTALIPAELR